MLVTIVLPTSQSDLSSSIMIQVIDTFLCQVTNPTSSPDPFSRRMQPQHQPQTEQTVQNHISIPTQSLSQAPSNVQSSAGQFYTTSPGVPNSGKQHSNEAPHDQQTRLSHKDEENQLHNINHVKSLPESTNESSVPEAEEAPRHSSVQENNTVLNQSSFAAASSNAQVQTEAAGDVAPIFSNATSTAESYIRSSEAQRRTSNVSSDLTPTQAQFNRSGRNGGSSSPVLLGEQTYLQQEQDSDPSFKSEPARGSKEREDKNQGERNQEYSAPQSHDTAQKSHSTEMTDEINTDRQASDHELKQRFSEHSDGMVHTARSRERPPDVLETEARSAEQPQVFSRGTPQEPVPRGGSSIQGGLNPPSQLHSASTRSERAARPFSFMEYSQDEPAQPRPEVLQRAPSIESIPSHRYLDRPPSPVSPQRSMTRDVSEQHEQTVPTHYDTNHDFFPSDIGNSSLRRPGSSSRPFQDPNLLEHPAFRHEGPQVRAADMSTDHYSAQRPREEIRLPRQQTTEYQLEEVGPPSIPRTDTKSRSRHSSRSSAFFRNLGNPGKVEGPPKNSPETQYAESPGKDAVASRKKSNRNSVFRTLTGRSGSDREQTPVSVEQPVVHPQINVPQQPILMSPRNIEKDFVSSGTSSKIRNKLQRASTSVAPEKPVGKKRFSAIGVSSAET